MAEGRRGAALILCVLLLMALTLLAHGALLMSREELAVSRAGVRLLAARAAADAGLAEAVAGAGVPLPDSLPRLWTTPVVSGSVGQGRYRVAATRLSRELWLVEADGAAGEGPWLIREARPLWSLDPLARVAELRGVVEVAPGAENSGVSRVEAQNVFRNHPDLDVAACLAWSRALDSLARRGAVAPVATASPGTVAPPGLGLLEGDAAVAAAAQAVTGVGTPTPSVAQGACAATEPWNWGDPDDPAGPCHDLLPLVAAAGSLVVDGGTGQGTLAVRGDLLLTAGARFHGMVLVGGKLTLSEGAEIVGFVRAGKGVVVGSDARVVGSACWAVRALTVARPRLARPRLVPGAGPVALTGGIPGA